MKRSEFKESLSERLGLVKANTVFTVQRELAYAGNNWASVLSTTFFTISTLIFIKVIYSNVQTVAGYSYNEMLLFFFVYQMTYYGNWFFTERNLDDLIPDVNKGNLDMVLIKPVPSLFFIMTRTVSLVSLITDAVPPTIAIMASINWHALNLNPLIIIVGFCVWIMGLITMQTFLILASLPVFWFGESQNIYSLASSTVHGTGTIIPLEGYSPNLRRLFGTLIPVVVASGFTTSILLEKSNPTVLFVWALIVAVTAIIIRNIAWKFALKHYTSASS